MRYTWRIGLTTTFFVINGFYIYVNHALSFTSFIGLLLNIVVCLLIGYQIDKYQFSKRELGSTKKSLVDYARAMDSVVEAIGITNEKGEYEFVNDAHARLYGYSKQEFASLRWQDLYSKEVLENLNQTAIPSLLNNGQWKGEAVGLKKNGTPFLQELSLSLIKESKNTICVVRDITEQKSHEQMMKHAAEHNDLTLLPNRRRLMADLEAKTNISTNVTLLFIDLDRFKLVNDNLGHEMGDVVLKLVANRLKSVENEFVCVYHLGGDEFIVIVENQSSPFIKKLALELVNTIKQPYQVSGTEVYITSSIGISHYPEHTQNLYHLVKMADTAMYFAKISGKDTIKFFTKDLELKLERKAVIEAELRKAIPNKELFMLYQPKFNLESTKMVGLEALIRWEHPTIGFVSPVEFIPIAEETGLIIEIGEWVIHEVLEQMNEWQKQGYPLVKVSVNVSQRQFRDENLVQTIDFCLNKHQIDASFLEIEITESVMEELEIIIPVLNSLKELGVGISIDDFGTGYSSLNILKDLPIDTLKIDQSFIRGLINNAKDQSLVKTILQIGNFLNLNVVAEGIETEEHLHSLLQLNCPDGQGYYFSKPITPAEVRENYF